MAGRELEPYWKDNGNATSHGLGTVQVSFLAQEQILFAVSRSPRNDGRSKEENFNSVTSGQSGNHTGVVVGD